MQVLFEPVPEQLCHERMEGVSRLMEQSLNTMAKSHSDILEALKKLNQYLREDNGQISIQTKVDRNTQRILVMTRLWWIGVTAFVGCLATIATAVIKDFMVP